MRLSASGIRFAPYLISGDAQAALKAYLQEAGFSPVAWYPAALIVFRLGDFVRACTYLRKGIAGNPYVAEALTGRTLLADHLYWHRSNLYGCEFALDYLKSAGNDWTEEETDFVDWVFNSAAVLRERAQLMDIHQALTNEHDFAGRGSWVERATNFIETIDDQLSVAIVRKVENRWREMIWPWDRAGQAHPQRLRAN